MLIVIMITIKYTIILMNVQMCKMKVTVIKNTILLIEVQNKFSIFYFHTYTMLTFKHRDLLLFLLKRHVLWRSSSNKLSKLMEAYKRIFLVNTYSSTLPGHLGVC